MVRLIISAAVLAVVTTVSTLYVNHDGAIDVGRFVSTVPVAALWIAVLTALGRHVTARR